MPSSWSASIRLELQFTGENINLWGDKLNAVLRHADFAIAGWTTKALTGDYTLTTANAGDDEARAQILKFTGAGPFTVTIPSVTKTYDVWNACSAVVTVSTGAGTTVAVNPGEVARVICDGSNVKRSQGTDFGAQKVTGVADPTNPQDAATKAYADALAFTANAGILPGQVGNNGKYLTTNGATASWGSIDGSNIPNFSASAAAIWLGSTALSAYTPGGFYTSAAEVTITFASTMTPDMSTFMNAVVTMTGNATLANPTNAKPGQTGRIRFIQDATGSRTLAVGANWKRDGGALSLSTAANAIDILEFDVITSSYILYNLLRSPS